MSRKIPYTVHPFRVRLFLTVAVSLFAIRTGLSQPQGLTQPEQRQDTLAWNRYFEAWEAVAPDDARLWIDRFNHYFNLSRSSVILLRNASDSLRLPGQTDEGFVLVDSTGNRAGILQERIRYDDAWFARAIEAIDRGIELHPDRLDMWLGRAAAFMFAERYEQMVETLCRVMDRSEENGGQWVAADGKTRLSISPSELISDYLQEYVGHLFEAATHATGDSATESLGRLAEREANYAPADPVSLNNLATWYYMQNRTEEALAHFLRAAQADPTDAVLIYNIGSLYAARNDRANARKWWMKLLDSPDPEYRSEAPELLRKLDEAERND